MASEMFPKVPVWPKEVEPYEVLDEINRTINRFIVCEPDTAVAATLWIAFTWVIDHVQVAPLALITAPEKGCGKTQLLSVMGKLVSRPLLASNITPAALYRTIAKFKPTLLLDEADTFLRDNDEMRGIINSGHDRPSAYVVRSSGDDFQPERFSTWGAKVICGIGGQHDTIMDRSIRLELRRRLPDEKIERLRHAEEGLFETLTRQLARFAQDYGQSIAKAKPDLPEALSDRAQDNWEPLLAIADLAGRDWPSRARKAALRISRQEQVPSLAVEILTDIQEVFCAKQKSELGTQELLGALCEKEEAPWATLNRGTPMRPYALAKLLRGFGIGSAKLRFGSITLQGYRKKDFEDAWSRYLPGETEENLEGEEEKGAEKTTANYWGKRESFDAGKSAHDVPF